MKVKELITKLLEFDMDMTVAMGKNDSYWYEEVDTVEIEDDLEFVYEDDLQTAVVIGS